MASSPPSRSSRPAAPPDLDAAVTRFDRAWVDGHAPRLEEFIPAELAGPARTAFLLPLVRADLIRRWERPGTPPLLEWYAGRFPELGPPEQLPLDLIVEEFAARLRRGERPSVLDYMDRFPDRAGLVDALEAVDPERTVDARVKLETLNVRSSADTMTAVPDPAAGLIEAVQRLGVLVPKQLELLRTGPRAPRELCDWMVRQRWITPYQAERLLDDGSGLVIGPYLILEPIGGGSTGQVYRALHRSMRRVVALKVLRADDALAGDDPDPAAYRRFVGEIEAVGRLDNPHIVHTYDAGQHGGAFYLAMEYAGGTDLKRLVEKHGPLRVLHAVEFARQTAVGLQHAADAGLVHRDVKPANLLLARPTTEWPMGCVKILDLGLARVSRDRAEGESSTFTADGQIIGTADFMSPEQAADPRTVDARSDLYSLGCTLFFLLTGRPPYPTGTDIQKAAQHTNSPIPQVWRFREDVPLSVCRVVEKLMAKDPADRYQTAMAAAAAMGDAVTELSMPAEDLFASIVRDAPPAAAPPPTPATGPRSGPAAKPARSGGGWRWAIAGGVAVIAAGVAALAWALHSPATPTPPTEAVHYPAATTDPLANRGTGLVGAYFASDNFSGNPERRTDPVVDFTWAAANLPVLGDRVSVIWIGEIETVEAGEYRFQVATADPVRLFVQSRKLLDLWHDHPATASTTNRVRLPGRTRVPVRLEYAAKKVSGAGVRLFWERPNAPDFELVRRQYLYPTAAIADSRAEFSDQQGRHGWTYLYRKFENGQPAEAPLKWEHNTWRGPANALALGGDSLHPGPGVWVGRRWTAKTAGAYRVHGHVAKTDTSNGDGVAGVVLVNGEERGRWKIAANDADGRTFILDIALKTGDTVDFWVDPLASNWNDGTTFSAVVTPPGSPVK